MGGCNEQSRPVDVAIVSCRLVVDAVGVSVRLGAEDALWMLAAHCNRTCSSSAVAAPVEAVWMTIDSSTNIEEMEIETG